MEAPDILARADAARPQMPSPPGGRAHELAWEIRSAIADLGLQQGDAFLHESDLIERSGLGRATVREAIRILVAEGVIEARTGRGGGLFIGDPGRYGIANAMALKLIFGSVTAETLVEFRRVVDPQVAALAARHASIPQLRAMNATLVAPTWEEELDFHLCVADACGNELLRLLVRSVHRGMVRHAHARHGSLLHPNIERLRSSLRGIYSAIEDRDPGRAAECMRAHIEGIEASLHRLGVLHGRLGFNSDNTSDPELEPEARDTGSTKAAALANEIRQTIVENGRGPGDALPPEREWVARSGLARATVREAIRILTSEGLVTSRRGRSGGLCVAQPDPDRLVRLIASYLGMRSVTVGEVVEFRRIIEPLAAAMAAERGGPAQLQRMSDSTASPHSLNGLAFHVCLADTTGNEVLRDLLRAVHLASRQTETASACGEMSAVAAASQHRAIYEAVAAHDPGRAASLMRSHLEDVEAAAHAAGRMAQVVATSIGNGESRLLAHASGSPDRARAERDARRRRRDASVAEHRSPQS